MAIVWHPAVVCTQAASASETVTETSRKSMNRRRLDECNTVEKEKRENDFYFLHNKVKNSLELCSHGDNLCTASTDSLIYLICSL